MRILAKLAFAALSFAFGVSAIAGPKCTTEPKDKWMSEESFKKQVATAGYTVSKFKKTSGNCYEIYGKDKDGKKVEIYFNPVDGKAIETK